MSKGKLLCSAAARAFSKAGMPLVTDDVHEDIVVQSRQHSVDASLILNAAVLMLYAQKRRENKGKATAVQGRVGGRTISFY